MKSLFVAVVTTVLLAPPLASCGAIPARPGTTPAIATDPAAGHLVGTVSTMGGKDARVDPAEATVTATPTSEDVAGPYTTRTASDGSFSLDLPPGAYELTGTLITRIPGGVTTPQDVTIVAGETTRVEVHAIYPGG